MRCTPLFALWAPLLVAVAAWPSLISPTHPTCPSGILRSDHRNTPIDTFVKHFSADTAGTGVYLQTRFKTLFPNDSITVTQYYGFNLFRYASEQPDKVIMREIPDVESIKRVVYFPSMRRRDGDGVIAESLTFAGFDVAFGDDELKVYVATWAEGYSTVVQWHLIGKPNIAKRLIHDTSAYCAKIQNAVLVFDQGFWQPDYALWQSVQKASWEDVILDKDFKERVIGDYRAFLKAEKTYKELEVPWKRGLIFLGPPGNGKTISLKAIMKDAGVPALYVKSFHGWGGDEMGIRQVFQRARLEAPCLLVLEDLDSLINDDNRSFFLNEVDGLEDNDGLLMIGTTNHVDRLDPALSSRPSRFDRKYTFVDPKLAERRQYAVYWQNKLKTNKNIKFPDELLDKIAEKTQKFSFAYLKEAFVSTLLTLAGRDDEEKKGHDFPKVLMEQIRRLREQLDEEEHGMFLNKFQGKMGGGIRKAKLVQDRPSKDWQGDSQQSGPDPGNSILTTEGWKQKPMGSFMNDMAMPTDKVFMSSNEARSEGSVCFWEVEMPGPDGEIIPIGAADVPENIKAQMRAAQGGEERHQ